MPTRRLRPLAVLLLLPLLAGCAKPVRQFNSLVREYYSGQMVGAEDGELLVAGDGLCYPGQTVELSARLLTPRRFDGIEGRLVGFYHGQTLLGAVRTDDDGHARLLWRPPGAGHYTLTVRPPAASDKLAGRLQVLCCDPRAPLLVVDLDYTLVDDSFYTVLTKDDPKDMKHSSEVLRRLAERFEVVYLTQRPVVLARKSRLWLEQNKYPFGPLLTCELRESLGDTAAVKCARLEALRRQFPGCAAGIGDRVGDGRAYLDAGMTAYLIPHVGNGRLDRARLADEIEALAARAAPSGANPARLHVLRDWRQIESCIISGQSFPPAAYVQWLRR